MRDAGGPRTDTTARPPLGRAFLTVWGGQTASLLGTSATGVGVSIAVFVETGSVWWMSLLYLASRVPGLLVAGWAGALVDRSNHRRVLLTADSVAGAVTMVALGMHVAGVLEPRHLLVVTAVGSLTNAFQEPAYVASMPLLVPRDGLDRANGLVQTAPALGMLVAPAAAGVLVATGGLGAVLVADAVTFVVAVAATSSVRIPRPSTTPTTAIGAPDGHRIIDTWRSLTGRLLGLRRLLITVAILNVVLTLVNVLLFPLLIPLVGEAGTGAALSAGGVAMLAATAVVSMRGIHRRVLVLSASVVATGLGLVVAGLRPSAVVATVGLAVTLGAAAVVGAAAGTLFQTEVAAERQGRLMALRRVCAEWAMPIAAFSAAPLTDRLATPAMASDGPLASTAGIVLGTGPGRGAGLVVVLVGLVVVAVGVRLGRDRTLRALDVLAPAHDLEPALADHTGPATAPSTDTTDAAAAPVTG